MEIQEYTKPKGTFLKAEDVKAKPEEVFKITGEAKTEINEKFGNERCYIPGEFAGEEKIFDCSRTNARKIVESLTTETTKWVGAEIVLEVYKTKTSDGNLVDAINVKEIRM